MSLARKTLAKYGAKIPVGPNTGAKQARQGKPASPVETAPQAEVQAANKAVKKR